MKEQRATNRHAKLLDGLPSRSDVFSFPAMKRTNERTQTETKKREYVINQCTYHRNGETLIVANAPPPLIAKLPGCADEIAFFNASAFVIRACSSLSVFIVIFFLFSFVSSSQKRTKQGAQEQWFSCVVLFSYYSRILYIECQ